MIELRITCVEDLSASKINSINRFLLDVTGGTGLSDQQIVDVIADEVAEGLIWHDTTSASTDASGMVWDERIHASTKRQTTAGMWAMKRGLDEATRIAVEDELRTAAPAPVEAVLPVFDAQPVAVLPVFDAQPEPEPEPAEPSAAFAPMSYQDLTLWVSKQFANGSKSQANVAAGLVNARVATFPELMTNTGAIPAFIGGFSRD